MKEKNKESDNLEETHPLTWRIRKDHKTVWIEEYQKKNGYSSYRKVLQKMSPEEVIQLIIKSGLRGRGGAGFPTGLKWKLMQENMHLSNIRYLICNADEMEPGTYKDKLLMEKIPHLLIEGILIAAYALQTRVGYIFLRGEYIEAEKILRRAINESISHGWIGENILSSGFSFNLCLHTGAGRYICGEETALLNSLEGLRPNPRFKPPFPSVSGIWGKPTCVNNVETLCNIPAILEHGISWYRQINNGKSKDCGTKLMGFSGKVNNPGVWELPFGVTAREILEEYAGGMKNGFSIKAWQPGGASTSFLTENHLDLPMDFDSIQNAGSRLGTALSIAIDNTINMVSVTKNLEKFFARESCGFCTPCRDGLPWIVKILQSLENGKGKIQDIEILEQLCELLVSGKTFCSYAPGASAPLKSAIQYFRSEFLYGVEKTSL